MFLKISQNSQEKTCFGVSFLIKLQASCLPVSFERFFRTAFFIGHFHGCFWTTIPKRHPWHCCNALVELDFTQPIDLVFLVLTVNVQLLTLRKLLSHALHKKCPYSGLFWSSFSCIWTEYGEIRVSLRIQSECGKVGPRITTNTHTFHAVMDTLLNPFYASSLLLYPWKNQKIGGKKKAWNGLIQNNNL